MVIMELLRIGCNPLKLLVIVIMVAMLSCKQKSEIRNDTLFILHPPSKSGVSFENKLTYTEALNPYTFKSFYNGGGVGLGDFNQDGLLDIIFTGNLVSNKLYINKGNFKFEDVTEKAGLSTEGVWSTGVSVVDINADGLLDIYICKSGPPGGGARRKNELFINNGNLTFTEKAADYGLAFEGLSVHAAFFDYDKDGDLDCYLLNNSIRSIGGFDLRKDQRSIPDSLGGNRLLRNDNDVFVDVSQAAGIYSSVIGFGLGVTIGDINDDGWQDMYVSNDFFEKDYLYINNGNATFTESLESYVREISLGSMGADMADINNDGSPEIYVTEMLPESDERLKTTSQFESWDKFSLSYKQGYFKQFSRNMLQLNNGNGSFSEISRFAGVHATDWSWGALIFDMDNDGLKDIFVANGIYKDLINQDYVSFIADPATIREILKKEKTVIKRLIDSIPSNKIQDYAFHNNGNLTFTNFAKEWGLDQPSHSNGSAYGDLDNDGDVDLVLNNVNMPSFIYENTAVQMNSNKTFSLSLHGEGKNTFAIGAKVTLLDSGRQFFQELSPMRGFMSSVDYRLHFGTGNVKAIDSIVIQWPDGRVSTRTNVPVNQMLDVSQKDAVAVRTKAVTNPAATLFTSVSNFPSVNFTHQENDFVDFDRDRLLFNMASNEGPCVCTGDINNDKLEDFYIGGAKGQAGSLYIQKSNGSFEQANQSLFDVDKDSEDTDCVFFDADNNGHQDIYVTSGGNEFSANSSSLLDRLYMNRGKDKLDKSKQALPTSQRFESTSTVSASDYDKDGDIDLFVGVRLIPFLYGLPGNGYLLANDGKGNFQDVTPSQASGLIKTGLITDSHWADLNNDGFIDLIITGEWMSIKVFIQEAGKFVERTKEYGFAGSDGWYHALQTGDFNNDGKTDIFVGNHGLNSRFKATSKEPVSLYVNDFDQNGTVEHITTRYEHGISYPLVLRQDLLAQMPSLKKKFLHYKDYQGKTISDMFVPEILAKSIQLNAYTFESAVWINQGNGTFKKISLPLEAQLFPVYAGLLKDFNKDGNLDILLGGNLYRAKPETGIYDAGYGLFLRGLGNGKFESESPASSGVQIKGEIRTLKDMIVKRKKMVLVGRNNDRPQFLTY